MTTHTRTTLLATAFALSLLGLGAATIGTTQRAQLWQLGQVDVIDDGDPEFQQLGFVYSQFGQAGYGGDVMYCTSANSSGKAVEYDFVNLQVGAEYTLSATWVPASTFSSAVNIYGKTVNQTLPPDDFSADGYSWEIIQKFVVPQNNNRLTVTVPCSSNGTTQAPTLRIEKTANGAASCGNGVKEGAEQCDDGNANQADTCASCANNFANGASLLLRNVPLPQQSQAITLNNPAVAMRFTMTTGTQARSYFHVHVKVLQGDLTKGFEDIVLLEDTNGDGVGDGVGGRSWNGVENNPHVGAYYFPFLSIPANTTKTYDVRITPKEYADGSVTRAPNTGPIQITFEDRSDVMFAIGEARMNGACAVATCNTAIDTGPTPVLTYGAATTPAPRCGDGTVNQANEQCDDGNQVDADACKNNCALPAQTNPNPAPNEPIVVDDGDAGFTPNNLLRKVDATAHGGDYMECNISPFSSSASYEFTGMDTTAAYDVYATWNAASGLNPNFEFLLTNGANMTNVRTRVNQTLPPSGITHAGRTWQKIGYIPLNVPYAGGTFYVTGYCAGRGVLDAVMAVKVAPSVCGNGTTESGEECDDGNRDGRDACTAACKNAICGDYNVRTGVEQCDDGNTTNTDACTASCQTARCGDQIVRTGTEQCDDGNAVNNDACSNACQNPRCGDQIVQAGEQCDDGNTNNSDACRNNCTAQGCGNGTVETGEQCDDGNANNDDACTNLCKNAVCGDGFRQGMEQCDDGNRKDYGDGCNNACQTQVCSNGVRENPEGCDVSSYWPSWMYPECIRQTCQLRNTSYCGNGLREGNANGGSEDCDDGNLVDTDSCTNACETYPYVCGNGRKQGTEQCDDGNLVNGDGCSSTCQTQAVTVGCGNGVRDNGEICDNGTENVSIHTTQYGYCTTSCRPSGLSICGNGTIQGTEQCDDGNAIDTDACRNNCMLPTTCGNGVREGQEQCDDGNRNDNDACTNACNNARCMDGIVWTNVEGCDDGNNVNGDACSTVCMPTPVCGNGRQDFGEQCDDGNTNNADACSNICQNARCGDGVVRAGVEQCDDGNANNNDACRNNCTTLAVACGNGVTQAGEECDDGNQVNTDACTAQCRTAVCGDGVVRSGAEQCDDGNRVDADSCRNDCTIPPFAALCGNFIVDAGETCEMPRNMPNRRIPGSDPPQECDLQCHLLRCGDGVRHAQLGEQCDDGNQVNTDACNNRCQTNVSTPAPRCGDGAVNQTSEQCDDGNANNDDACRNDCTTASATPANAALTIRTVSLGQTRGAVSNETITAMRFTATAGSRAVTIRRLDFKAEQGNLSHALTWFKLFEDTDNDGAGDTDVAQGAVVNGILVFSRPLAIAASATKTYDLRVSVGVPAATNVNGHLVEPRVQSPLQIAFNVPSAYVVATYEATSVQVGAVSTNGSCAAAPCPIAVFTPAPSIVHTFKRAGNLTVTGEAAVPPTTLLAGGESDAVMNLSMRASDDENLLLNQLAFSVQGAEAVERLELYMEGVHVGEATIDQCANMTFVPAAPVQAGPYLFEQKFCAILDDATVLRRGTDTPFDVRATIKEVSAQWAPGTDVRLTLLHSPDGYLKATGETSRVWLTKTAPENEGGRTTVTGTLQTNVHEAF